MHSWLEEVGMVGAGADEVPINAWCTVVEACVSTSQSNSFVRLSLTQVLKAWYLSLAALDVQSLAWKSVFLPYILTLSGMRQIRLLTGLDW